jgi:hypothetical protein
VLTILAVAWFLVSEPLQAHLPSINNNLVVQGFACGNVFHPPYELKAVLVQLFNVADGDSRVRILLVVFLQECLGHMFKLGVFVAVLQVHECLFGEGAVLLVEHEQAFFEQRRGGSDCKLRVHNYK